MHVGLLTYRTGHLKTWELATRLLSKGFRVSVYAFPFKLRPPKDDGRYPDRPNALISLPLEEYCDRMGIRLVVMPGWDDEHAPLLGAPGHADTPEIFLHCIAKIVPASFIGGRVILNCHPGLLPHNRGVDAFKWSLLNDWPFGITLHVIDAEIDRGVILKRAKIPVLSTDTFRDVCDRAYAMEIDLMGNFEYHLKNGAYGWAVGDAHPCSHRSIPIDVDRRIEEIFIQKRNEMIDLYLDSSRFQHPSDYR